MPSTLTVIQVQRSIQRFTDYTQDLLRSDYNTFEDRLNLFFSFCEEDHCFSRIHEQLKSKPSFKIQQWIEARYATVTGWAGSGELSFPTDTEQRLALMYQLLLAIRSKGISWQDFGIKFFVTSSSRYDEFIAAINDAITEPLVRELTYRLQDIEDELPSEKSTPISASTFQIIHRAENVIQQYASGSNITQTATLKINTELTNLFTQLRDAINNGNLTPNICSDALEIVDSAEREANSAQAKPTVIRALLSALPQIDTVLSITASILSIISATMQ